MVLRKLCLWFGSRELIAGNCRMFCAGSLNLVQALSSPLDPLDQVNLGLIGKLCEEIGLDHPVDRD